MGTILLIVLILLLVGALPSLAIQQWMGLLPQRWTGSGCTDCDRAFGSRKNLSWSCRF